MRTGIANLPLHGGKCPAWLFTKMKTLGAAIIEVIVEEYGPFEVLKRLADPYWFQSLGCVLGFDWHSSGVTTTVCGALKEGLKEAQADLGIFLTGGKGRVSRNTPNEIARLGDRFSFANQVADFQYASRMAAKVDSSAVQDGYQIYHHFFVFTPGGDWTVIQQGMNEDNRQARRYHWLSRGVEDFVCEPHSAICCDATTQTLNLVAGENKDIRQITTDLVSYPPASVIRELELIKKTVPSLTLPARHSIPSSTYLNKALSIAYDQRPRGFEALLGIAGIGAGTLRALALVAELTYGIQPSYRDPARYSFAHGGKDGHPYPVNREDMEHSTRILQRALKRSKAGQREQLETLQRLGRWYSRQATTRVL
jgi:hypothetical protein